MLVWLLLLLLYGLFGLKGTDKKIREAHTDFGVHRLRVILLFTLMLRKRFYI